MSVPDSELVDTLQQASQGLLWMSESEAPLEVIAWQDHTTDLLENQTLLNLTQHSEDTPIATVDFEEFFQYPTQIQDWFGEEETASAQQYQQLAEILKTHLQNLKVYRVGEVTIEIYILGRTENGNIVGLVTKAVET
jgi:hypothetical protein